MKVKINCKIALKCLHGACWLYSVELRAICKRPGENLEHPKIQSYFCIFHYFTDRNVIHA